MISMFGSRDKACLAPTISIWKTLGYESFNPCTFVKRTFLEGVEKATKKEPILISSFVLMLN
jgi:hypothetical protein